MARDKVDDTDRRAADDSREDPADQASGKDGGDPPAAGPAKGGGGKPGAARRPAGAKAAGAKPAGAKPAGAKGAGAKAGGAKAGGAKAGGAKAGGAKAGGARAGAGAAGRRDSGTGATAARTRTVMQRRHLRVGFAMAAALGVELAGVAGLVTASLLAWEWGEALWGRTEAVWLVVQVALGLTVVALAGAWLLRPDPLRARSRTAALLPAATVAVLAGTLLWQADPGSRGAGPAVALVAAVLVAVGGIGWLLGLRQLRVLFPFGLSDARSRGFGNLDAVRRARLIGAPAGAVGGIALVAGALLVAPGWVTTVDSQTTGPLALTGEPAGATGDPAWTMELAGAEESQSTQVWATPGGVVIEELTGVRAVDPRTGEDRWHWRDDAYQRVAGLLTEGGRTVVLALAYDGESTGRDRVVALDTATGELRWERFDDDLVGAMERVVINGEEADWFVVPDQEQPTAEAQASVALWAIDSGTGQTRWRAGESDGCSFTDVIGRTPAAVVTSQQCTGGSGGAAAQEQPAQGADAGCRVTGLAPDSGEQMWTWPTAPEGGDQDGEGEADQAAPTTDCQLSATAQQVVVSYQRAGERSASALDPATGEQLWTVSAPDDDLTGLRSPALIGDVLAGAEWVEEADGTGHGELVVRDTGTGEVVERVVLPEGRPIEVLPGANGGAAIAHYRPDSAEVVMLEVDVTAGEVRSETLVAASPAEAQYRRVSAATGPEALVVEALVVSGANPEDPEYQMYVYGW